MMKRTTPKKPSIRRSPPSRDAPPLLSASIDDHSGELAISADLEPIERAIRKLRERFPAMHLSASVASPHSQLDPAEEVFTASMNALRRAEFTGGRLAAKRALSDAGHAAPIVIVADKQGVPIFPEGYVGSIAHKHGRAVAIAARAAAARGIGIDLEFDEDHDEDSLVAEVLTEAEQRRLAAICTSEPSLLSPATLVLAAKEALYKAAFQVNRTEFSFDDAELLFASEIRSFWAVRFPGDEKLTIEGGYELAGRWIVAVALVAK